MKSKKPPQKAPPKKQHNEPAHELDAEQAALGNAALMAQMGPGGGQADHEAVREYAAPLVERAMFALQVLPRSTDEVARLVDIVGQSRLPDKQRLVERLQGNQDVALQIEAAMELAFGSSDEVLRSDLVGLLDQVWETVQANDAPDADGTIGERAEAWVGDVAGGLAPPSVQERVTSDVGSAIRVFARQVYLALALDEEEEEELLGAGGGPVLD